MEEILNKNRTEKRLKEMRKKRITINNKDYILWKDVVEICLKCEIDLRKD